MGVIVIIRLIANKNCNRCEIVKGLLSQRGIEFEPVFIDELDKKEQNSILSSAREKGFMNFPILMRDGEIIDTKEVL